MAPDPPMIRTSDSLLSSPNALTITAESARLIAGITVSVSGTRQGGFARLDVDDLSQ